MSRMKSQKSAQDCEVENKFPVKFAEFLKWTNVEEVCIENLKSIGYAVKEKNDKNLFKKTFAVYKCFYEFSHKRHKPPLCFIKTIDSCTQEQRDFIFQQYTRRKDKTIRNKQAEEVSYTGSEGTSSNSSVAQASDTCVGHIIDALKEGEGMNSADYEFPVPLDLFKHFSNCEKVVENLLNTEQLSGKAMERDSLVKQMYKTYYLLPKNRECLKIIIKPCPAKVKTKLLCSAQKISKPPMPTEALVTTKQSLDANKLEDELNRIGRSETPIEKPRQSLGADEANLPDEPHSQNASAEIVKTSTPQAPTSGETLRHSLRAELCESDYVSPIPETELENSRLCAPPVPIESQGALRQSAVAETCEVNLAVARAENVLEEEPSDNTTKLRRFLESVESLHPENFEFPIPLSTFQFFTNCQEVVEKLMQNDKSLYASCCAGERAEKLTRQLYYCFYLQPQSRDILQIVSLPEKLNKLLYSVPKPHNSDVQSYEDGMQSNKGINVSVETEINKKLGEIEDIVCDKTLSEVMKSQSSQSIVQPTPKGFLNKPGNRAGAVEANKKISKDATLYENIRERSSEDIAQQFSERPAYENDPQKRPETPESENITVLNRQITESQLISQIIESQGSATATQKIQEKVNITTLSPEVKRNYVSLHDPIAFKGFLKIYIRSLLNNPTNDVIDATLQQITTAIFGIFDIDLEKHNSLPYLLRSTRATSHIIIKILLKLTLEEFKAYVRVYAENETPIFSSHQFLEFCHKFVTLKPQIWPRRLYITLQNLLDLLRQHGMSYERFDLSLLSPKVLHWTDLIKCTNYDECVRQNYFFETGEELAQSELNSERRKYYDECYSQSKWVRETPFILDKNLKDFLLQGYSSEGSEDGDTRISGTRNISGGSSHGNGQEQFNENPNINQLLTNNLPNDVSNRKLVENSNTNQPGDTRICETNPNKRKNDTPVSPVSEKRVSKPSKYKKLPEANLALFSKVPSLSNGMQLTHKFRPLALKNKAEFQRTENSGSDGVQSNEKASGKQRSPIEECKNTNVLTALSLDNTILNCTELGNLLKDPPARQQASQKNHHEHRAQKNDNQLTVISKTSTNSKEVHRPIVFCVIKKLHYFRDLSKKVILQHQLPTSGIGQRYVECLMDFGNLKTLSYNFNNLNVILLQKCKLENIVNAVNYTLSNLEEYHFDLYKTNIDRRDANNADDEIHFYNLRELVLTKFFSSLSSFCYFTLKFTSGLDSKKDKNLAEETEIGETDRWNTGEIIATDNECVQEWSNSKEHSHRLISVMDPRILKKIKILKLKKTR